MLTLAKKQSLTLAVLLFGLMPFGVFSRSAVRAEAPNIPAFFNSHCFRCHGESLQEADFRLDDAASDPQAAEFGNRWARALERINSLEMPPKEEPQPTAEERYAAAEWIAEGLQAWDAARYAQGERVSFKKLTRIEYVHTLQDLIGVTYHPNDPGGLPEDPNWRGFERIGSVLSLSPSHIERYLTAADLALKEAIPLTEPPKPWSIRWHPVGMVIGDPHSKLPRFGITAKHRLLIGPANNWRHYVGGLNQITLPHSGLYRIRIGASGLRPKNGSVPHLVFYDATIDRTLLEQDVEAPEEQPIVIEKVVRLPKGAHDLTLRNELPGPSPYDPHQRGGSVDEFTTLREGRSPFLQKLSDNEFNPYVPMLILDFVEIEAVIDPWPPAAQTQIMTAGARDENHARTIVARFAERAFRRPVQADEVERYLAIVNASIAAGTSFEEGVRDALLAILCSHEFLFLVEGSSGETRSQLNDFELASRLSYFLWSTMPDDRLMDRARAGELRQRDVLAVELERMLNDPRSKRFADEFSRQWLQLRDVGKFPPDKKLYPSFDAGLQRSMVSESQAYFERMLSENRPIREFIDSDWSMLNHRLADHYEVAGVVDFALRPVTFETQKHRGGILTQASALTLTSDGFRQRPVHRGKWILETVYGTSPPPPPPNVGTIPTPVEGEPKRTLRAKLEAHRTDANCAACHAKIDPLGFALDNFDAIGRWREVEDVQVGVGDAPPLDASGVLADGRAFSGPDEFKKLVAADADRFAQALTEKLATYAMRRGMSFSDRKAIELIVSDTKQDEYRLRSLLKSLVLSDLFQRR